MVTFGPTQCNQNRNNVIQYIEIKSVLFFLIFMFIFFFSRVQERLFCSISHQSQANRKLSKLLLIDRYYVYMYI